MNVVYMIGVPGAGKSTAVQSALLRLHAGATIVTPVDEPVPHLLYHQASGRPSGIWQIGRHRDRFGGTDTLGMAINPKACAWVDRLHALSEHAPGGGHPRVLIGEGDRLSNARFFDAAARYMIPRLTLVHLSTDVRTARERAAHRARLLGTNEQNPAWWKGRVTKVANLVELAETGRWGDYVTIDGDRTPEEVAADLAAVIDDRRTA